MTVTYLDRAAWGAGPVTVGRSAPHAQFTGLVAHHTVFVSPDYDRDGVTAGDAEDVVRYMRWLQHARPDLGPDVPYSFCVFEGARPGDCIVAEGRGFGRTGAHTSGFNSSRYGVALAGNSSQRPVTEGILSGYRWIGRKLANPAGAVPTIGHRDTKSTECPGHSLYAALPKIQPPFADPEEDDMDETTFKQWIREVLNEGTGKGQRSWADTSKAQLAQAQQNTVLLNTVRGAVAADDVDEAALAAALLPGLVAAMGPEALAVALAPHLPQPEAFVDALRAELTD